MAYDFDKLLNKAVEFHGHMCVGQVIGVRMAIVALRELGLITPEDVDNLIVYVESDRCIADAIMMVTYRRLGRRTLKLVHYGKMAATFVDTLKNKAVRIHTTEECRKLVKNFPDEIDAYSRMTEDQLLRVEEVDVTIPEQELPGAPGHKAACENCGEIVYDMRIEKVGAKTLCRACAFGAYYTKKANLDRHS